MIRIELLTIPDVDFPAHWRNKDGRIYLDTPSDLDIRASRRIISLNALGDGVTRNTVERFSLPITPKNRFFLGEEVVPDLAFLVSVMVDSIWLPYNELIVTGLSHTNRTYEVELLSENYLDRLDGLSLREIELDGIIYNQANVEATWDGQGVALFAPVHYNQWLGLNEDPRRGTILWQDLRPLFNLGKVLQAVFNYIGYSFSCPFLTDTSIGKNLFAYLLKGGWGSSLLEGEDVVALEASNLNINTINVNTQPSANQTWQDAAAPPISGLTQTGPDAQGRWNGTAIEVTSLDSSGAWSVTGSVVVRTVSADSGLAAFAIIHEYENEDGDTIYDPVTVVEETLTQGVTTDLALQFPPVSSYVLNKRGGTLYLAQPVGFLSVITIDFDVDLTFEFQSFLPVEGKFLRYADTFSNEYSALDLVKGVMHFMDGILDIDEVSRVVTLHPPTTTTLPSVDKPNSQEVVDGFLNFSQSVRAEVVPNSMLLETEDEEFRPVRLDFKDGDDAFNTFTFYEDKYQYVVGQAEDFDDPRDSVNPFFLKTLDVRLLELEQDGIDKRAVLPAIWGGSENEELFYEELGPRLLLLYGTTNQRLSINYEETEIFDWPYVSQYPGQGAVYYPLPLTYTLFAKAFHENNPLRQTSPLTYEFLVHFTPVDFYDFDFSKTLTFEYENGTAVFQPIEIRDFSNRYGGPTPVQMIKLNDDE